MNAADCGCDPSVKWKCARHEVIDDPKVRLAIVEEFLAAVNVRRNQTAADADPLVIHVSLPLFAAIDVELDTMRKAAGR
jgi:hypothetical protein